MGNGYYWIDPVDQTLNDFRFYKARIVGDPEYDERHHRVILRLISISLSEVSSMF